MTLPRRPSLRVFYTGSKWRVDFMLALAPGPLSPTTTNAIKRPRCVRQIGVGSRKRALWVKMKPEYSEQTADLDLLILGAAFANGKMRSGLLSRFLLGVAVPNADGSSPPTKFWPITRVRPVGLHEWVGLWWTWRWCLGVAVGDDVVCRCCRAAQWVAVAVAVVVLRGSYGRSLSAVGVRRVLRTA